MPTRACASVGVSSVPEVPGRPRDLVVVTETWPPEVNGVAMTLERLVVGLRQRGHRVRVVRPRQAGEARGSESLLDDETLVPGCPIPGYRGLRFGLPAARRLRAAWRADPPDAVHLVTEGPLGHSALRAARALGLPVLAGFHTDFETYARHYRLAWLAPLVEAILRRFHNRCDLNLIPTRALAEHLAGRGFVNLGLLARGVDTRLFHPARRSPELRAAWGAGPEDPVLMHVGRVAPEKDLDRVVEAFRAVRARRPRARLVFVGDGPSRARLERAYPDITFAGVQRGEDLASHYASADLFVFASLSETFGNVVTEAMASGLPILAFDHAAVHEHVVDRVHGRRVPVTGDRAGDTAAFVQAAVELAEGFRAQPRRREAMGEQARARAEELDWGAVVTRLEQYVEELLETRGAPAATNG